jgi:hypothetical protein
MIQVNSFSKNSLPKAQKKGLNSETFSNHDKKANYSASFNSGNTLNKSATKP